jgi:hypothetical protein
MMLIIIHHELGLDSPVSASSNSSSKVFHVFFHFVYNSALFWQHDDNEGNNHNYGTDVMTIMMVLLLLLLLLLLLVKLPLCSP